MSDTSRDPAPGTYNASPTDQARTYQTGGTQHITEYHYHGTPPPTPPARTRSLAMRVLLAAGLAVVLGGGGTALWVFNPWQSVDDARSSASPEASTAQSPRPSATAKPTGKAAVSAAPPAAGSETAPAPAASDVAEQAEAGPSSPSPKQTQAQECRGRTAIDGMTLDICMRRTDSDDIYMSYRLTGTETPRLVDVYMWLEETATERVVDYVAAKNEPYSWPAMSVGRTTRTGEQLVEVDLRRGTSYEICVGVLPPDSAPPQFRSTEVGGFQYGFVY
ncbi:hypothetical protein [Streptomyces sp. YIM B13518]|uniref:hypothetical protein n=1 Tax=Streptomyces sp. YIM B13518 TaxID=3366316 RepID=UPI00368301FB